MVALDLTAEDGAHGTAPAEVVDQVHPPQTTRWSNDAEGAADLAVLLGILIPGGATSVPLEAVMNGRDGALRQWCTAVVDGGRVLEPTEVVDRVCGGRLCFYAEPPGVDER